MLLNILTYFLFIYKVLKYCNNILIIGIYQSLNQINTNLKYIDIFNAYMYTYFTCTLTSYYNINSLYTYKLYGIYELIRNKTPKNKSQ